MLESLQKIIANANKWSTLITLVTLTVASIKNWFIANQNLNSAYKLMLVLGISYLFLNTHIAFSGTGHEAVFLMNIPALWTIAMGWLGLKRLSKEKNNND